MRDKITSDYKNLNIKKLIEVQNKKKLRYGPNVIWMKEQEDDTILRLPDEKFANGVPTLSAGLNDFECGVACFAGKPNSGKSTLLVNMMTQSLLLNDDLIVVDLTLDDPFGKRYEQYIASLSGLPYQKITTVTELTENEISRRDEANKLIFDFYNTEKLITLESKEVISSEQNKISSQVSFREFDQLFRFMKWVRHTYPDKKIALFIDAWNNMNFGMSNDIGRTNAYLSDLQQTSNTEGIMVILSAHLRKGNNFEYSEPSLEDIKGTSDMIYNIIYGGIVINEFKDEHPNPIMYVEGSKQYPMIIVKPAKVKTSFWDSAPMLYGLKSGQCGLVPLSPVEYKRYLLQYKSDRLPDRRR